MQLVIRVESTYPADLLEEPHFWSYAPMKFVKHIDSSKVCG